MNMRMRKLTVISAIFLSINPVLAFIFSLLNLFKRGKSVFVFSLSLSIIFIYFPIMFDTSSNFFVYYYHATKDIFDIYTYMPSYLESYGFNYIQFILISIFLTVYSWSKICVNNAFGDNKVPLRVFFIVLLCSFHYRDLMDLNRNITAYALVFLYLFYVKDRFKYSILVLPAFIVLTFYIHLSVIVIWFFYFISRFIKIKIKSSYLLIIGSAFIGLTLPYLMPLLQKLLLAMPGAIGSRIYFYIYGSEFGVQVFSLGQALQKALNFMVIFFAGLYAVKVKNSGVSKLEERNLNFVIFIISVTMIFVMYMTLFERLNLATNFIYGYLVLRYYRPGFYSKVITKDLNKIINVITLL